MSDGGYLLYRLIKLLISFHIGCLLSIAALRGIDSLSLNKNLVFRVACNAIPSDHIFITAVNHTLMFNPAVAVKTRSSR
jgi:hypothetical protein